MEGIRKLLNPFILNLLRDLLIRDADLLQDRKFSFGLIEILLDAQIDVPMIAEVFDGIQYQGASRSRKTRMLDEFVANTGYARKYAIQLLNHPKTQKSQSQQAHLPHYGSEVQQALLLAWKAANQICPKMKLLSKHREQK